MTKTERALDLICLGRAAVDLYGEQIGAPLQDVDTFTKSLGGCAANVAVGASRQGLRTAMLTRVGDEQMGRFVTATLHKEGVHTGAVSVDPERLTGLVLLSIRDVANFPLIFYRTDCADMALRAQHVDPDFIASSRALLLTGTHLSTEGVRAASLSAAEAARAAGTQVVLDIDYRPVLWRLTGHGRGDERYVPSSAVTEVLQDVLPMCDLVVGTEEELHIAGGSDDTLAALRAVRDLTSAPIVLKRGHQGCIVYEGAIPEALESGTVGEAFEVDVLNVLGAGDAFLSGFLRGWLQGEGFEAAARYGNACGALVVSRHACAPAIPTRQELDDYLDRPSRKARIDQDPRLDRLHWVTTRPKPPQALCVLAFDHRRQLEDLVDSLELPRSKIAPLKRVIVQGAARACQQAGLSVPGVIVDGQYGQAVLDSCTGPQWWVARPIEQSADPGLAFEGDPNVELELRSWPSDQVVKCLVHPVVTDAALRTWQDARLVRLFRACQKMQRRLLIEVLPRARPGAPVDPELLPEVLERLYDLGIQPDWWKLPPPKDDDIWRQLDALIAARDPHCHGVLVLGLAAPQAVVSHSLERAGAHALCRGFAVGRTIFFEPAKQWLTERIDDEALIEAVASSLQALIEAFRRGRQAG